MLVALAEDDGYEGCWVLFCDEKEWRRRRRRRGGGWGHGEAWRREGKFSGFFFASVWLVYGVKIVLHAGSNRFRVQQI
jgi:hypothetical protein